MGYNCINWDKSQLKELLSKGFTKATLTYAVNQYQNEFGAEYFPSDEWLMNNTLLGVTAGKKEVGVSKYNTTETWGRILKIKSDISKANNRLRAQGINRIYEMTYKPYGQSDRYEWTLVQRTGVLNVEAKIARLKKDAEKRQVRSTPLLDNLKYTVKDQDKPKDTPTGEQLSLDFNLPFAKEVKPGIPELFESNPELANNVYEALGLTGNIIQDNKSYYRGQIEQPTIDKNGNLVLYAKEDELYKRAGLKSKGVSMTDNLKSAIDYGNGQLEVARNLASESYDAEQELDRLLENGYYLIQIPKNISNEVVKEAGEVKVIGDKIIIPKGQYKIEQVVEDLEAQTTPTQQQQAQQLYSQYLNTIFPDSKVKDIVYHGTDRLRGKSGIDREGFKKSNRDRLIGGKKQIGIFFTDRENASKFSKDLQVDLAEQAANRFGDSLSDKYKEQLRNESNPILIPAIINASNPINLTRRELQNQWSDLPNKVNSVLVTDLEGKYGYEKIVFEPEQIHILGSKQDIEGFKAFVGREQEATQSDEVYRGKDKVTVNLKRTIDPRSEEVQPDFSMPSEPHNPPEFISLEEDDLYEDKPYDEVDESDLFAENTVRESISTMIANSRDKRFFLVAQKLKPQLEYYYKERTRLRRLRNKETNADVLAKLYQEYNVVDNKIKELEKTALDILNIKALEGIAPVAEKQLAEIAKLLEPGNTLTAKQLQYIFPILQLWSKSGKINNKNFQNSDSPHFFFTAQEWGDGIQNMSTSMTQILDQFMTWGQTADKLMSTLMIAIKASLDSEVSETFVDNKNPIKIDWTASREDVGYLFSQTLDVSEVDDPVLSAIHYWNKKAVSAANMQAKTIAEDVDRLVDSAMPALKRHKKNGNLYDILLQTKGNNDPTYTGNMVNIYSQTYWDERVKHSFNIKSKLPFINKGLQWMKQHETFFDARILFPRPGIDNVTAQQREDHINHLKRQLGEEQFQEYYLEAQSAVEEYNANYAAQETILYEEFADDPKIATFKLDLYEKSHSPYQVASYLSKGSISRTSTNIVPQLHFIVRVPLRTLNNKDTGYYDSKYEIVQNDPELKALYDYCHNTLKDLKQFIPGFNRDLMQTNALPYVEQTIVGFFLKGKLMSALKAIWASYRKSIIVQEEDTLNMANQDLTTGQDIRRVRMQFSKDHSREIIRYVNVKRLQYKNTNNGKNPSDDLLQEWRNEIKAKIMNRADLDLSRIIKGFAATVLAAHHKQECESQMFLAQRYIDQKAEVKTTATGNRKKILGIFGSTKKDTQSGMAHYKQMADYFLDHFYGYPTRVYANTIAQDKRNRSGKVIGTKQWSKAYLGAEKDVQIEIKKLRKQNKELYKEGKITLEELNKREAEIYEYLNTSGGVYSVDKHLNHLLLWTSLKSIGWNIKSGISNTLFGYVSNWTEAGDGRIFNQKDLREACLLITHSMLRNYTFNLGTTPTARKIRSLMDHYQVLKESKYEVMKKPTETRTYKAFSKLKFLAPFNLQARTEYINQAIAMTATLKHIKIQDKDGNTASLWDAYDKHAKLKPQFRTEENIRQYEGDFFDTKSNAKFFAVKARTDKVVKFSHGNYDEDSPIQVKKKFFGRALIQFRTWALQSYQERFGKEHFDTQMDMVRKGRYRTSMPIASLISYANISEENMKRNDTGMMIRGKRRYGVFAQSLYNTKLLIKKLTFNMAFHGASAEKFGYSEVDAANIRKNLNEALIYLFLLLAEIAINRFGFDDDDEDENGKKKRGFKTSDAVLNLTVNQLNRVEMDVIFYVNPAETMNMIQNNAMPLCKTIDDMIDIGQALYMLTDDNKKNDYMSGGPFKGVSRLQKETMEAVPFASGVSKTISDTRSIKRKYGQ